MKILLYILQVGDDQHLGHFVGARSEEDAIAIVRAVTNQPDFVPSHVNHADYRPHTITAKQFIEQGTGYFDVSGLSANETVYISDMKYIPFNLRKHFIDLALEYLESN